MIANDSGTGKSFIGLAAYLKSGKGGQNPERIEWTAGIGVNDHPGIAASEMRMAARSNTRVEKPVYHFSINWHPDEGELVDRELALKIVKTTLDDLGLSEHQALVVAHNDTDHFHVHVMVNRIHPETHKSWKQGLSKIALEKSMAQQSLEHGFDIVPGHHNAAELGIEPPPFDTDLPSGAQWFEDRTGDDSDLTLAREALVDPITAATSWDDLAQRLDAIGYRVEPSGRGMIFRDQSDGYIKASAVSREFSRERLEERFNETFPAFMSRIDGQAIEDVPALEGATHQEASQDPQTSDRGTPEPKSAIDVAGDALRNARSWSDLDAALTDAGFEIERRGRGFVIKTPEGDIKPSDIDRSLSTKQLEERFNEPAREYFRKRTVAEYPARARALKTAVARLTTFEKEAAELEGLLRSRDNVWQRTERTYRVLRDLGQAKGDLRRALASSYRDPVDAQRKFDQYRKKNGLEKAAKQLAEKPKMFGPLRGRMFVLPEEKAARDRALKAAVDAFKRYRDAVKYLNDNRSQVDADKEVRAKWEDHRRIAALSKRSGATIENYQHNRIGLEREVLQAARGLDADQIEELPISGKLRRTAIAATVDRLRDEAGARRRGDRGRDPAPPLTATPDQIKAFDAAKEYAEAKRAFDKELRRGGKKVRAVNPDVRGRLEKAANTIVNDRPKALDYVSRFGVRKADVVNDASKITVKTRTRQLTQRLARFQAQLRETGKGVGIVLSLFRRR